MKNMLQNNLGSQKNFTFLVRICIFFNKAISILAMEKSLTLNLNFLNRIPIWAIIKKGARSIHQVHLTQCNFMVKHMVWNLKIRRYSISFSWIRLLINDAFHKIFIMEWAMEREVEVETQLSEIIGRLRIISNT